MTAESSRRVELPGGRRAGPHLPMGPGLLKAAERAGEIGASALQIFSDNPTAWRRRPEPPPEAPAFRRRLAELDIGPLAIHAAYLVNLAGADDDPLRAFRRGSAPRAGSRAGLRGPLHQRPCRLPSRRRRGGGRRATRRRPVTSPGRGAGRPGRADGSRRELIRRRRQHRGQRRAAGGGPRDRRRAGPGRAHRLLP